MHFLTTDSIIEEKRPFENLLIAPLVNALNSFDGTSERIHKARSHETTIKTFTRKAIEANIGLEDDENTNLQDRRDSKPNYWAGGQKNENC